MAGGCSLYVDRWVRSKLCRHELTWTMKAGLQCCAMGRGIWRITLSREDRNSVPREVLYWVNVSDLPRMRSIGPEGRLETRAGLPWTWRQLNIDDFRRNQVLSRQNLWGHGAPSPLIVLLWCVHKKLRGSSHPPELLFLLWHVFWLWGPLRTINSHKASLLTNWWMVLTLALRHVD